MWELGLRDHSRERGDADSGIEVRRTAGFRPETTVMMPVLFVFFQGVGSFLRSPWVTGLL